jgi:hypothetical protein
MVVILIVNVASRYLKYFALLIYSRAYQQMQAMQLQNLSDR